MTKTVRGVSWIARRAWIALAATGLLGAIGCTDQGKISAERAQAHTQFLLKSAREDVAELKRGMPKGVAHVEAAFKEGVPDAQTAQKALETARGKVQDLRVAKSTFFAIVGKDGVVVRNDQDQDLMAGKNMFAAYPKLKAVLNGKVVETAGTMAEAAGVRGKPDAQWVFGVPIKVAGEVVGAYVSGWSWSAYAYRLETSLRSDVLSSTEEGGKVPLLYVYVLVDGKAYGAPISPTVNGDAILKENPLEGASEAKPFSKSMEIEGRQFGLSVVPLTAVQGKVGIAVLRSET